MQLRISQVTFPPDAEVIINEASWEDYERLMEELEYTAAEFSPHFPGLDLRDKLPEFIQRSRQEKRSVVMGVFRAWADSSAA